MISLRSQHLRGTVSLVALCFVAVLGIVLASYLTLCSRAMNLSNRSYQAGVAQQLAEFGLEEALRAFNKNDWSGWASNPTGMTGATSNWSLDTTTKRATRTITFTSGKLGQGTTASVKIRIDNYDAAQLNATWSNTATYRINDLVGYNGNWYRCVKNHTPSQTPAGMSDLTYWAPAPISWTWIPNYAYKQYDVVSYNGSWYRCETPHSSATWAGSNWSSIRTITAWTSMGYSTGDVVNYTVNPTTWFLWNGSSWVTPNISWQWRSGATYSFDDQVYFYNGTSFAWYRCKVLSTSGTTAPSSSSDWENTITGIWAWESAKKYAISDAVYYSGQWYRCIQAHTSDTITPSNTAYWSNAPLLSTEWQPGRQYSQNDVARYKGIWFLYINATASTGNLPMATSSSYWAAAPTSLAPWDSSRYYSLDDLISYTASGTTTWYRCIKPHKAATLPSASSNWTVLVGSAYAWSPTASYTGTSYVSYGGAWYKCTAAHTGQSPNNTDYWIGSWKNSMQPTGDAMGAPVIYAEATVNIPNSPASKAQLRAAINPTPLFPNAAGATTTLTVSGAGTVESYDGSVRAMSNGIFSTYTYNETSNTPFTGSNANGGFSAVLAASGSSYPSLSLLSGTTIKGYVATKSDSTHPILAQVANGVTLQNSDGSVTSFVSPQNNVDLTRISRSAYVPQFDPLPLTANWGNNAKSTLLIPASGSNATIDIGYPGGTTPSRYYYAGDLTISSSSTVGTLNIHGPVILYIGGYLKVDTGGTIRISSAGSAEIHLTDALQVTSTSNGIDNRTLDPKRLVIISDTTGSAEQYYNYQGSAFYGLIYAPKIDLTSNGTAMNFGHTTPTSPTVYGAVSARKITFTNNANVRYDTSLRSATIPGVDQPYAATNWRVLPIAEQATMP